MTDRAHAERMRLKRENEVKIAAADRVALHPALGLTSDRWAPPSQLPCQKCSRPATYDCTSPFGVSAYSCPNGHIHLVDFAKELGLL